ncbi:unnamed protein product [Microthlaspi erraticum]|uniref:Uncharacterized protein n=1 Tax=Microthlaspi erraticum TaxID=1685480 RepID=A0A6D2IVG0_9BRAS|nr:unnamed protein product [Microthlaspi erraticum]
MSSPSFLKFLASHILSSRTVMFCIVGSRARSAIGICLGRATEGADHGGSYDLSKTTTYVITLSSYGRQKESRYGVTPELRTDSTVIRQIEMGSIHQPETLMSRRRRLRLRPEHLINL